MIHRSPYPDPEIPRSLLWPYVSERFAAHARRAALIDGSTGAVTTYAALQAQAGAGSAALAAAGIGPGDVVALMSHNQPAWAAAFYSAIAAGAAVALVNPHLTEREVAAQLVMSGARLLLAAEPVVHTAAAACGHAGAATAVALEEWLDEARVRHAGTGGGPLPAPPSAGLDPDTAVAALPFSSGTTGTPKAVPLTHRNLVANIEQHRPVYHMGPEDVACAAIPFFHIYGLTMLLNSALRHGATVVTMPRYELPAYLHVIERHGVTKLHLAPPMVLDLATRPEVQGRALSSLRTAVCGAAPLDPGLAERAARRIGVRIGQGYGMTEASPGVTFVPEDLVAGAPAGSVGRLVPGTEARIVAPGSGADEAADEGELWVRGPQVMAGRLGDAGPAEVTAEGWLRTGDLVHVDAEGWWWVVDRLKELIKCKGFQVAPAELEALLLSHPQVADAAVIGVPDARAGEVPAAWVVARGGLEAESLLGWVASRVAPYKRVREVHVVAAIPRSPAGKVLRRVLRAEAAASAELRRGTDGGRSAP